MRHSHYTDSGLRQRKDIHLIASKKGAGNLYQTDRDQFAFITVDELSGMYHNGNRNPKLTWHAEPQEDKPRIVVVVTTSKLLPQA